jgi:hypothetical protein
MQELLVSFLIRMAFLLGEGHKEADFASLHRHTLGLLSDALALWPSVPVKITFLNKLLDANLAQNVDPPPTLVTGARGPSAHACTFFCRCSRMSHHAAQFWHICAACPQIMCMLSWLRCHQVLVYGTCLTARCGMLRARPLCFSSHSRHLRQRRSACQLQDMGPSGVSHNTTIEPFNNS